MVKWYLFENKVFKLIYCRLTYYTDNFHSSLSSSSAIVLQKQQVCMFSTIVDCYFLYETVSNIDHYIIF